MSDIEAKLKTVEKRYKRKTSKSYQAARYIIRQNREIPKDEREKICEEIPIKIKSLQAVFTELVKMGLYPPQLTLDIAKHPEKPKVVKASPDRVGEESESALQKYVTVEDFEAQFEDFRKSTNENLETLNTSITNLASLLNDDPLPNLGGHNNPGEVEEAEDIEVIHPGELLVKDGSSTRESLYIKPKTRIYFDLSKQGTFHNYPDSRELGPLANFNGTMSDFFNIIVDDYFIRLFNADIGLTMRRYVT